MSIADLYQIAIIEKSSIMIYEARLLTMPVRQEKCTLYAWIIHDISYVDFYFCDIEVECHFFGGHPVNR